MRIMQEQLGPCELSQDLHDERVQTAKSVSKFPVVETCKYTLTSR
jgi:hypothetical protein